MKIIKVYTDGACSGNPGPGGWGGVIVFPNEKQELSGYEEQTTNNRMELKAVLETLRLVTELGYKRVDLYTDSAYVVNSVNNGWLKKWKRNGWKTIKHEDVKNKDLWESLDKILHGKPDINVIKVKGHSDNIFNNRCDAIAKREIERASWGA